MVVIREIIIRKIEEIDELVAAAEEDLVEGWTCSPSNQPPFPIPKCASSVSAHFSYILQMNCIFSYLLLYPFFYFPQHRIPCAFAHFSREWCCFLFHLTLFDLERPNSLFLVSPWPQVSLVSVSRCSTLVAYFFVVFQYSSTSRLLWAFHHRSLVCWAWCMKFQQLCHFNWFFYHCRGW